jgi:predicted nucleotidyltransferase
MNDPWSVLTLAQAEVARVFLRERERERRHIVCYLSGAHAYGFPSPDSDLDLKCVHITPTAELVGLETAERARDRTETVDGVELDYGSNELGSVLRGAIRGNGNYLERILGELTLAADARLLAEARALVAPVLSRRVARHYGGFARRQLIAFDERPTAKRALYVLRTAATGRHVLAHGEVVTDVNRLEAFVPRELDELLRIKRSGERSHLTADHAATWRQRLEAAIAAVEAAAATSVLPPDPPAAAVRALDAWLVEVRRGHWSH